MTLKKGLVASLVGAALLTTTPALHAAEPVTQHNPAAVTQQAMSEAELQALAKDAYLFGSPFMDNYRIFLTRLLQGDPLMQGADFNEFAHNRNPFPPQTPETTQRDTIFSLGMLDLRAEPVVISVDEVPDDQVYMLQLGDTSTETLPYISSMTTGNQAANYLLVGPDYQGLIDTSKFDGVIKTRGQFIVMLGRTVINDHADLAPAHAVQDAMAMQPMSAFLNTEAPAPATDVEFLPWDNERAQGIGAFDYINMALAWEAPSLGEMADMARFARIGVIPGERFSTEGLSAQQIKALEAGVAEAKREMKAWWATPKATHGAWNWDLTDRSRFGDNYLNRAAIASQTIYPNAPDHAVYGRLDNDDNGVQLKGDTPRTLTFAAGELPPVEWFWSITMYESATTAMYANPAERYSVGMKTDGLVYNDDGSLTFTLSHDEPTEAKARANWLPAPEDDYYLILRLYGAKQDVIDGHWAPPAIAKAQ